MPKRIAKQVTYFGQVQGVGFRRRTAEIARDMPVFGYVMNLADGSVKLVAEGEAEQVDLLLSRIAAKMRAEIRRQDVEDAAPQNFADFQIRR